MRSGAGGLAARGQLGGYTPGLSETSVLSGFVRSGSSMQKRLQRSNNNVAKHTFK